jgi:restriction endonuclease S subunit
MTMKNEILNVPPLRFPEFSSPWISERLGASCEIQMCKRIFAKQTATNGAVPFFKIGTVGGQPDAFISDPLFEEYSHKYHFPKKGEILITCAGTIGRCFQYDGSKAYYQDSNIVWISNPSQRITNDFLLLLLEAQNWKRLNATTIARLYNDDLLNCILFFPEDRIEQEKIASFLSAIDKRISVQMKIIEDCLKIRKAYLKEVFLASENSKKRVKEPLESSKIWKMGKVSYYLQHRECPSTERVDRNHILSVKLFQAGVVQNTNTKNLELAGTVYYSRSHGDFIYGKQNLFNGAYGVIPEKLDGFYSSSDLPTLSFTKGTNPDCFLALISLFYKHWEKYASGTGSKRIHEQDLLSIPLIKIPGPDQDKIAKVICALDSKIKDEKLDCELLLELKKFMLRSLFIQL